MSGKSYVGRYAQAVFEIALEKKELERWQSDLKTVVGVVGDVSFKAFLESPKFRFDDKSKLLSERLKDINPLALHLVYLLVHRGKLDLIGAITDEYRRKLDSYHGIEQADVITAVPLGDREKEKLVENLSTIVGKKVVIRAEVDPDIIGGLTARIGGKLLDGSTRRKLVNLKRELAGTGK